SITESSPFSIISNLFNDKTTSTNDVEYDNEEDEEIENIISLGILTELEVIELISNFRRNYGRWVSFPSNLTTEDLIKQIKKTSSLLLTSCCLVSIRYQIFENKQEKSLKYFMLIQQLIKDLNNSLIKYTSINNTQKKISGQVEFLQAITILSIYSISISKLESSSGSLIKLDPWILSNIGLSTFITKTSLGEFKEINEEKIVVNSNDGKEYDKVMIMRIYNHLCLAHIVNSIFSGRLCIIDSIRVEQTTTTLSLLKATNFDGRMVSEIGLLFITYNYLQSINKVEKFQKLDDLFHKIIDDIKKWFIQWEYLFNQPVLHFLEFNYNFCSMFVYYIYCHQRLKLLGQLDDRKSISLMDKDVLNHVFKSIDNEDILLTMFDYCLNVLYHINNIDNDSYFAYLSDQIHFIFFFCGIFMIKLTKVMIDKQVLINKDDKNKGIKVVKQLIHKFNKITNDHPDDILNNYKLNLESCISENM
ncbi:Transcriptional activator of proteases prtT, partial [Candida tropicalis]